MAEHPTEIRYHWVRFNQGTPWQVVKFYKRGKRDYMKGLDWGLEAAVDDFRRGNDHYEIGQRIEAPMPSPSSFHQYEVCGRCRGIRTIKRWGPTDEELRRVEASLTPAGLAALEDGR